ncbi:Ig mu chain C region [Channa argus]|uniref:Ig mu chain C region n=1 Tax=Channa argus TaxID=215402 RepID=A0A6G1QCB9_CHAAH|nr:Ig mu chain C region [Channa argus]
MMCMIEDGHGGTLNSFKWKKNGVKVDDFISSTIQKIGDSHSAVSVLKVKNTEWDSKAVYTCEVTYQGQTYTKKVSKGPITVTLNQPSPKEMFNNNQTVLDCVITGQDKAVVDEIEITWKIDGENVTGQTGVATSEDGQYRKTSTMTRSHTEWKAAKKVSCSAVREDMTPIVQELTVNKGDGSEPKVTVLIEEIKPSEVTVVCLVFSSVLQDYYIAWSELKDNVSGNYVNGINFPEQKTPKGYLVTSVYTTTNKESEKKVFNCNVWPAGRNEAMTPHGVSLSQGNSHECDK